jgi:hypothetical protein
MIRSYSGDRTQSQAGPQEVIRHTDTGDSVLLPKASQKLYNHSPDGFQWGYGGSGPAQLALAILLDITDNPEIAVSNHQSFKRDKIAGLGDTFIITVGEIERWLKERGIRCRLH